MVDASNFWAGAGDAVSTIPFTGGFSVTDKIRRALPSIYGDDGGVDKCSTAYGAGKIVGVALRVARTGLVAKSLEGKALDNMTLKYALSRGPSLAPGAPPMF